MDMLSCLLKPGVVDIEPENIKYHGRLEPGKMFLVDMVNGEIVNDSEIKNKICSKFPYGKWNSENALNLSQIPYKKAPRIKKQQILKLDLRHLVILKKILKNYSSYVY